jgi:hypothetical protein
MLALVKRWQEDGTELLPLEEFWYRNVNYGINVNYDQIYKSQSEKSLLFILSFLAEEDGGLPAKAAQRPEWAIFGKVNQNMETILFREKFADWPDTSRLIGVKKNKSFELKVCCTSLRYLNKFIVNKIF